MLEALRAGSPPPFIHDPSYASPIVGRDPAVTTLLFLLVAIGLAPLVMGSFLMKRSLRRKWPSVPAGSVILCALAFNLTFFWQELW